MKDILQGIGAVILVIAIFVGIAIGGQHLGLWMEEKATNKRTDIANDSLARQQAVLDNVQDKYRTAVDIDVQLSTATPEQAEVLSAQRKAVVVQFCDDFAILNPDKFTVPTNVANFAAQECF